MVGWLTPGCWRRGGGASRGRDAGEGRQASPQGGCELTHFYTVSFTWAAPVVEEPPLLVANFRPSRPLPPLISHQS